MSCSVRAVFTRAPIALPLAGSNLDSAAHPFPHRSLGAAVDRYAVVVLRRGLAGKVHISLRGDCPEAAFGLAADVIDRFDDGSLRGAGIDLMISAPGEYGPSVTSAIAVALVGAVSVSLDLGMSPHEIARAAEQIHSQSLGRTGGWEHCSAQGNIQLLCDEGSETAVQTVNLMPGLLDTLERRLLLFSSGDRPSPAPLGEWETPGRVRVLHNLRAVAEEMRIALEEGSLDLFGKLLDLAWSHERSLPGRATAGRVDAGYLAALDAGAAGGRALSPGLLLLYGSRVAQEVIEYTMAALGWQKVPFHFDTEGVRTTDGSEVTHWPVVDGSVQREIRSWSPQSRNAI